MKEFFKPNKFKIIFSILYILVLFSFDYIPNFIADIQYGWLYSFPNFVVWVWAWPTVAILHYDIWRQMYYEGCKGFCFPGNEILFISLFIGLVYVYILASIINYFKKKNF